MDFPFSGASEVLKSEFDLLEEESLERPDTETEEEREDGGAQGKQEPHT